MRLVRTTPSCRGDLRPWRICRHGYCVLGTADARPKQRLARGSALARRRRPEELEIELARSDERRNRAASGDVGRFAAVRPGVAPATVNITTTVCAARPLYDHNDGSPAARRSLARVGSQLGRPNRRGDERSSRATGMTLVATSGRCQHGASGRHQTDRSVLGEAGV